MLYLDTLCLLSKLYVDFKQREQMLSSLHYHHIDVMRSFVCEVSVLGIKDGIRAAAFVRQISHEPRSIGAPILFIMEKPCLHSYVLVVCTPYSCVVSLTVLQERIKLKIL